MIVFQLVHKKNSNKNLKKLKNKYSLPLPRVIFCSLPWKDDVGECQDPLTEVLLS